MCLRYLVLGQFNFDKDRLYIVVVEKLVYIGDYYMVISLLFDSISSFVDYIVIRRVSVRIFNLFGVDERDSELSLCFFIKWLNGFKSYCYFFF